MWRKILEIEYVLICMIRHMVDNKETKKETSLRRILYLKGEIDYRTSLMNFEYPQEPVEGRKTTYSLDGWKRQIEALNIELLEHQTILSGTEDVGGQSQLGLEKEKVKE